MGNEKLTISLNEVLFFFTRAGFGVNAPIGVAEDFARSNIWIAENGFDPCLCSLESLKSLDNKISSLSVQFKENNFYCPKDRYLSSLIASVVAIDRINLDTEDSELILKNVDYPILVIAAMGANNCNNLQVFWRDENNNEYLVRFNSSDSWELLSSNQAPIELSKGADMIIRPINVRTNEPRNIIHKKYTTSKEKGKILQGGVEVGENWPGIYDFFSRCLVKSTAESRAMGAGAGLVDTD
jgi:hypothetical protein